MSRSRIIAAVVAVLVVIAAVVWLLSRGHESTDDAQIDGHITQIAARVGGPVIKVAVDNNDRVDGDALLVQIDPRDYQIAVDRARGTGGRRSAGRGGAHRRADRPGRDAIRREHRGRRGAGSRSGRRQRGSADPGGTGERLEML